MFVKDVARLVVGAGDRYQMRPALREQRSAAHGASTRPGIVRKPPVCRAFGLSPVATKAGGSGLVTVSFRRALRLLEARAGLAAPRTAERRDWNSEKLAHQRCLARLSRIRGYP
jgi:hypothetical protein